jgi:hypothetical protein
VGEDLANQVWDAVGVFTPPDRCNIDRASGLQVDTHGSDVTLRRLVQGRLEENQASLLCMPDHTVGAASSLRCAVKRGC